MNSKTLQKLYPEIYEDFFSKNLVVVSAPRILWWTGEYAELFGGPTITQKIPLRIYIGISSREDSEIKIGSYKVYVPSKEGFFEANFTDIKQKQLIKFLNFYLKDKLGLEIKGFDINILTELPLEHGQGSFGCLAAALSTAIFVFYKRLGEKEIKSWKDQKFKDLINNEDLKFSQTHRFAWKIEVAADTNRSSGCRSFSAMTSTEYPIVFFTESRSGNKNFHPRSKHPSNIDDDYDILDKIKYWADSLDHFFKIKNAPSWPIDFGLIYGGVLKVTGAIISSVKHVEDHLSFISRYTVKKFKEVLEENEITPSFYELALKENGLSLWNRYIDAMTALSLEILETMEELFRSGNVDENIKKFIHQLNCYHDMFHLLNVSNKKLNYICSLIEEKAHNFGIDGFGLKFSGSGGGGDIIFATSFGKNRNSIEKIIYSLKREVNNEINLDYTSWEDGIEDEGIRLEQDISNRIYSPFIAAGSYIIISYNPFPKKEIISLKSFQKEKENMPILIDEVNKKIYIKNQPLNSKQLHSTKETIKILKILLNNLGREVKARDLPESSYIYRNEMQSKIISPLNKITREIFDKKLPIKISGGLRKNYSLKLDPPNIPIYLLTDKT